MSKDPRSDKDAKLEAPQPKGRVLIVDDDPAWRLSLQTLLEEEFEVVVVSNMTDALTNLARATIHVVITDFDMKNGTGLHLLQRMETSFPNAVGILLTGHREHPDVQLARKERHAFLVLPKSYKPEELINRVRNALTMSHLREARHRFGNKQPK